MSDIIFIQNTYDDDVFGIVVCGKDVAYIYRDDDSEEMRFQADFSYDSYLTADDLLSIANKMKEMESSEVTE